MHVGRVALVDFRSWAELELAFEPGINALVGPNGQGKTNIVEAVGYMATLASHRVATDAPLVRSGSARSVVRVEVARDGRSTLLEVEINPGKANRARINRAPVSRARDLLGGLRTVLFAPEDLALVRGDPSERRRFLDDLLVARQPRWAGVRSDYDRVLKQRNALLKTAAAARRSGGADMRTLDVWDSHLAAAGSELLAGRLELTASLHDRVQEAAAIVGGIDAGKLRISYRSSVDPEGTGLGSAGLNSAGLGGGERRDVLGAALLAELARRRPEEIERGTSLVGPHRDDLILELGTLPAKGYASHGEGWSVALALRLASFHLLKSEGAEPVLILDDVFAELDTGRRRRLADHVVEAEQVLISAAVADDVPEQLTGTRFDVMEGSVTRVL